GPGANGENARAHGEAGAARQRLARPRPAVVILVEVEQLLGGDRAARRHAAASQRGHHLRLADGMAIVEIERVERALLAHATYDKSKPFPTVRGRGSLMSSFKEGLEDIVVSTSEICFIDGREGRLLYRGFDVDDLA